jgi:hypothetical protein
VIYSVPIGEGVDDVVRPHFKAVMRRTAKLERSRSRTSSPSVLKVVGAQDEAGCANDGFGSIDAHNLPTATDYEPQPAGAKGRPKAIVSTFRVLTYQTK